MSDNYTRRAKLTALYRVAQFRPLYTTGIIILSIGAAVFEGIGISFILPIIELAQNNQISPGDAEGLLGLFLNVYQAAGVPFTLGYLVAGVGIVMTVRFTLSFLVAWLKVAIQTQYIRYLQEEGFESAVDARISYFDNEGSDDILNAIVTQSEYAGKVIRRSIEILQQGFMAAMFLTVALIVAPVLTILFAVFFGGLTLLFRYALEGAYSLGDEVAGANEQIQEAAQAGTQGIRDVKLFGMRQELLSQFTDAVESFERSKIRLSRNAAGIRNLHELSTAMSVFILIYLAITFTALTVGKLGIFLFAVFRLGPYLSKLNEELYNVEGDLPHLVRTQQFIDELEANHEWNRGEKPVPDPIDVVSFDSVNFSYEAEDDAILSDVSFQVKRGEFAAFVGPSGAGKSTIVSLIARMYRPDSGVIKANEVPIDRFDLSKWRSHISVVRQNPHIFNETLRENVTIGNRNATQEEIERVCRIAQVTEFLDDLPQGYDTVLGDDGIKLSGGQRQRIAIARALLKDAELLVLDEATSDLDTELEERVHRNIERLDRDYTILVIAHRLSTVINADRIYTMEDGQIVERGPHSELLQQGGTYARLYDVRS
ncbi:MULTISPECIES: ABC transporter ATP-binding protein [Salinibaculum]|uniref:ABC transporter ATP-binding protein n=1 Tax=Salinibaculum TaxID=2732368 RepID=UPI0030CB1824